MSEPPSINGLLFVAASGFSSEEERSAFLAFACRGDEARLKLLENLLDSTDEAEDFFQARPVPASPVEARAESEGVAGTSIGPYRIVDRLGCGGCGVVYLAEQTAPVRRKVALKIIRLGMDTENVIARFAMEREALALMDHPNIARVLDAGVTASGRPYFVMELVDGERITDFCDRQRLDLRERLRLFIQVCEAIQHAHQKGVIHRDIKPSNVLVRDHDGRPSPKVIDFGIAKATAGGFDGELTVTRTGQLVGTPAYMSPEQADGGADIDTRSDIYSLGALLFELLAGTPPFLAGQFKDLGVDDIRGIIRDEETGIPSNRLRKTGDDELTRIAHQRMADPLRLPAQLSGDLDWIVMKAIEKDRSRRYETANGLAMDVQRFLNEEPVLARPPSRRYLLVKLVRRNRITFIAGAVAMFGLLAGFGTSTWLYFLEKDARKEQARLRGEADLARMRTEEARSREILLREKAQAADLVAQAAVLVRYKEMAQADALLATLPPDRTPLSLEAADTLKAVADWNLIEGRTKAAAERFSALVPVLTSVDLTDTDQMSRLLMPASTAIKEWGEPAHYLRLRELAIRRFADTSNDAVAAQAAKSILLAPADEETLRSISSLAAVLENSMKAPRTDKWGPYFVAWRQFSLALLTYRQGRFDDSAHWARRSLNYSTKPPQLTASDSALLGMIDLQQGRVGEGQAHIEEARRLLKQWEALPFQLGTSTDLWFDWGNARILLREADGLLAKAQP